MLTLRLPANIEKRLDLLAKTTGRSKSFYAREAILRHLEELEDHHLARRRLARKARRVTLEELENAPSQISLSLGMRRIDLIIWIIWPAAAKT